MKPQESIWILCVTLFASVLAVAPSAAQQVTGEPGSPSATTTIKGDQLLPMPDEEFGGKIELNFYGFMGGDTSQWQPANLARNTTYICPV